MAGEDGLRRDRVIPMHTHDGPEFHYVPAGELEETVESKTPRTVKAGEWEFVPGGHAARAAQRRAMNRSS